MVKQERRRSSLLCEGTKLYPKPLIRYDQCQQNKHISAPKTGFLGRYDAFGHPHIWNATRPLILTSSGWGKRNCIIQELKYFRCIQELNRGDRLPKGPVGKDP